MRTLEKDILAYLDSLEIQKKDTRFYLEVLPPELAEKLFDLPNTPKRQKLAERLQTHFENLKKRNVQFFFL